MVMKPHTQKADVEAQTHNDNAATSTGHSMPNSQRNS